MNKLYCAKDRKFEKSEISYLLEKTLAFFIICCKYKNEDEKTFKKKIQLRY